jgi:ATP-dependent exoDNAse (exonuclease V) beta subunit
LFNQAFDGWLQTKLADPPEGVRRSLRRGSRAFRPGEADEDGPVERLRRAGLALAEWRDFRGAWTKEPFDRSGAVAHLIELVHRCAALSEHASYAGDNLFLDTEPVRRLSRELKSRANRESEIGSPADGWVAPDLDGLESQFIELRRNRDFKRGRKGSGPTYAKGVTRAQVLDARGALMEALADFQRAADADLAATLHEELLQCVDEYEHLKAREGALDFLDLLIRARNLLRDDAAVRRHFQTRFSRIFVDEFQDTDPLQAELLLLLAADDPRETDWRRASPVPGKLFVVGDPKQSIYRFRRADVETYLHVCEQLKRSGARQVELRKSFRSVPNIQRAVNTAFHSIMDGSRETLQARYVPLEPCRSDHGNQPSVVVLPVPEPYSNRHITGRQIEQSLPDAVGAFVAWLLNESGWTVTERVTRGAAVPIQSRHICLLFRRFLSYGSDVTRPYVDALEARGIRHLLVGGRTFHNREEIETLRAALMAIEWPDDQLSVFALLRGALFAIGDEELLEYYQLAKSFHPFRVPKTLPPHLEPVREALTFLARLHRTRNRRPVAETISALLDRTRAHVGFVLRPGGEQALANVLHVAELARQYELDGGMSFRGFVEMLHSEAATYRPAEAPILEEGSDGVRLMTVHKAKGLEFPVVILADMTARLTPYEASRHIDSIRNVCALRMGGWSPKDVNDNADDELGRERAEGERIAYVAATRARDVLVVPAVGDQPYADGWISPLNDVVYPREDVRRQYTPGRGCPPFRSRDSVLRRPEGDPASFLTVCPGLHEITGADSEGSGLSVVWWAPDALTLGVKASFGLRRDDLIVKDVSGEVLRQHLAAYEAWKEKRRAAIESGKKPSLDLMTATEWAPRRSDAASITGDVDVTVEMSELSAGRPGGRRFGTLVHALLASVPLGMGDDALARLASAQGRVLGATSEEVSAAHETVRRVMQHPVMQHAADAEKKGLCYRETPVTWRLSDRALVEGYVDLAYVVGDEVVVVEFKTDRELAGALETYRRQVQIYGAAVGSALGRRPRAVLMRV